MGLLPAELPSSPITPRSLAPTSPCLCRCASILAPLGVVASLSGQIMTVAWDELPPLPPSAGQSRQFGLAGPIAGAHRDALIVAGLGASVMAGSAAAVGRDEVWLFGGDRGERFSELEVHDDQSRRVHAGRVPRATDRALTPECFAPGDASRLPAG